ncbi:hypothetical protein WJX74_005799 [Apatococcus lobatus]|uniref:Uncharacterized protein n=1 Tax=Apatococcus lobatus TaxID=904363 RepID=A0AAW1Q6H5_9CHLO
MLLRGAQPDVGQPGQTQLKFQPVQQTRGLQPHRCHNRPQLKRSRRRDTAQLCQAAAAEDTGYGSEWATPEESYLVLGVAHCFEKTNEGRLTDRFVIEPINASSLESMVAGASTCFQHVYSTTLRDAQTKDKSSWPEQFQQAPFCENFEIRSDACSRTWLRGHAQDNLMDIVPLGQVKSRFNYNVDLKRVLNFENVVDDSDNVKQDMSIDVYGRKDKEEEPKQKAAAPAAKAADDDDDLDDLLSV